ncbi:hypothetical protein ACO0LL_23695 [Undibacterium sp. TC4M20W]|uniref:hypothetical protein n=1 Tax=Undibacterium sp. TC4M20W TaxID=3413052 RepID=UPI003BF17641
MALFLFPLAASVILLITLFLHGRGDKAIFSLLLILLFLFVVSSSFSNGAGIIFCLLFGPWLICITMVLTYYLSVIREKSDIVFEKKNNHPDHDCTRRVLDPCLFYGIDGRLLTYDESLDQLYLFDKKECNEFLGSIGYPLAKKGESLRQSRQRCVDAYKKEYIKYS